MATPFDKASIAAALRDRLERDIAENFYKQQFLLSQCEIEQNIGGDQYSQPVKIARGAGVSRTYANAVANASSATYGKWRADYKPQYKTVYINNQAIAAASKKSEEALIEVFTEAVEDGKKSMLEEVETSLWRSGSGARGVVGSVSTTSLVLSNPEDVVNFEKGDVLVSAAAEVSGGLDTGTATISRVDRSTGTLYCATNWTTNIAALAAGRFLFRQGDRNLSTEGLLAHHPLVRTASPFTFQNVDLSQDWTRLAGVYVASKNKQVTTAILDAMAIAAREGAQPKCIALGPAKFGQLCQEQQNLRMISGDAATATLGFSGVEVPTPHGVVKVYSAQKCPDSYGFGLPQKMKVVAQGLLVDFPGVSGDGAILSLTADETIVQLVSYYNLFIPDPYNGIVMDFTA